VQVGEVAVPLLEVEAVADEELVGDGEADVADRQVVDEPAVGTVEQSDRGERGGVAQRQRLAQVVEGEPGVDHVLDDEDVAVGDLAIEVLEQADAAVPAGVGTGRVGRELEEVETMLDRQRAREIGQEDEARLQRRDQQRFAVEVITRDVFAELADARLQLLAREVDVAETALDGYDASSSRYRSARRSMSRL
jgi:hypothetical protein